MAVEGDRRQKGSIPSMSNNKKSYVADFNFQPEAWGGLRGRLRELGWKGGGGKQGWRRGPCETHPLADDPHVAHAEAAQRRPEEALLPRPRGPAKKPGRRGAVVVSAATAAVAQVTIVAKVADAARGRGSDLRHGCEEPRQRCCLPRASRPRGSEGAQGPGPLGPARRLCGGRARRLGRPVPICGHPALRLLLARRGFLRGCLVLCRLRTAPGRHTKSAWPDRFEPVSDQRARAQHLRRWQ